MIVALLHIIYGSEWFSYLDITSLNEILLFGQLLLIIDSLEVIWSVDKAN